MSRKSRWIETELEREGVVTFVPLRCCLEVKKNRRRAVIQFRDNGVWETEKTTEWVAAPGVHRLPKAQLDEVAATIADLLMDRVENYLEVNDG